MNRKLKRIIFLLTSICLLANVRFSLAYSVPTHRDITRSSIIKANIEALLQTNLAVSLSTSSFTDLDSGELKTGDAWIVDGSAFEDDGVRWRNHFHHPLTNLGLTDPVPIPITGNQSAPTWATSDSDNDWSWSKARDYYYFSLTAPTASERSNRFAKMFRALGQVVHLIQDVSVPEHVRNDQHLISALPGIGSNAYEPWVTDHTNPLSFSATPFAFPANFPLRSFWDTDLYMDSPTQQGPFTGLAEFTSYNFLSESVIFTENNLE